MNQPSGDIIKKISYSDSLYFLHSRNIFYTHPLEDSYIVQDDTDASFNFLLQEDFSIAHEHIVAYCIVLLQKDFGTFHVLLHKNFLYQNQKKFLYYQ